MRSILLAAGLASFLHGLLFALYPDWEVDRTFRTVKPEPVHISLSYKKKEPPPPPPVQKPPESKRQPTPPPVQKPPEVKRQPAPAKAVPRKEVIEKKPAPKVEKIPEKVLAPREPEEQVAFQAPPVPNRAPAQAQPDDQEQVPEVAVEEAHPAPESSPEENRTVSLPPPPPFREAFPAYQKNPPPVYPRVARRRGYEGTVVLEALVNRQGRVDELRLFHSSGYDVLDKAALTAVKAWLFEPAMRGDEKVEMWVKIPVRFRLQ